ncbi:MAG: acyltransferase family protein [Bacteroidia bacterium]|nr:acyltransferase family protein [Bacteroidia bacterium]
MENPPIPKPTLELVKSIIRPMKAYFQPKIFGLDAIEADKPALYVCNHTIFGLTDGIFLGASALERKGVLIHALIDNMHMQVPIWRDLVQDLGMIPASREACSDLMAAGEHVMVFPGGSRETWKHKGEEYQLVWKNRLGFAHMAIEHGYDILPVASVGGEETYEILWDADDIMKSPVGYFLKKSGLADKYFKGGTAIPPIVKGVGITGLPRPERLYIKVGDRISTRQFKGKEDDEATLLEVRGQTETALESMFAELMEFRESDKDEEWWRKWLKNL